MSDQDEGEFRSVIIATAVLALLLMAIIALIKL
jgi:hypothetical protein